MNGVKNQILENKLAELPNSPGVYFHKDKTGQIIYVGKAAVLRNRVRQYFQKSRYRDPKTDALVADIADIDWTEVDSEIEALFLEAEMIRRYMPKYNILLRDDKSMSYIRIDIKSNYPTVTVTRRPLDDGAQYFGPYLSSTVVRQALRVLRKVFPFAVSTSQGSKGRVSLDYHLGLDPGLEQGKTSLEDYRRNLRKLIVVIQGGRNQLVKQVTSEMHEAAGAQDFELAAKLRNQLQLLNDLQTWIEGVASDQFSAEAHVTPGSDPAPVEMANVPEQPPVSSADSALPIVDTPTEVPIEVATESEINYEALAAMQREILPVTAGIPEEFREIIKPSKYFSAIQIAAQIKTESNFDPNAKSGAGAMGLSQFMPETWPEVARQHPEQTNPAATRSDPQESVVRQRLYMDDLHERILKYLAEGRIYGDPVDLTLAAYNAGMGNVLKARGVPNFTETKNYIKRNKQTVAEFVFLVAAENS